MYISSPNNYVMQVDSICVDHNEDSLYIASQLTVATKLQGTLVKITYDGDIDYFYQATNSDGDVRFTQVICAGGKMTQDSYSKSKTQQQYIYVTGQSNSLQASQSTANYDVFFSKFHHQSGELIYTKNVYTGDSVANDYIIGGDVSLDGQFFYLVFYTQSAGGYVTGTRNMRLTKFRAVDGQILLAKATLSSGEDFQPFYRHIQLSQDQNQFLYIPHSLKNAYSLTSASYYNGALMKLDSNLDVVWYYYARQNTQDDHLTLVQLSTDTQYAYTGGIFKSSTFGRTVAMSSGLDISIFKLYQSTGAPIWGKSFGGTLDDQINDMNLNKGGDILVICGKSLSASFMLTGVNGDAFVALFKTFDGSLILTRRIGGNQLDELFGVRFSSDTSHIVMAGVSKSTTPRLSNGFENIIAYKFDFSLQDNDCMSTVSSVVTTLVDIYTALSSDWVKLSSIVTYDHTSLYSADKSTSLILNQMQYNTDYYQLGYCSTPNAVPQIPDKRLQVGIDVVSDWDDVYSIDKMCYLTQTNIWSSAQLAIGSSLPSGFTFNSVSTSQTFQGKISTPGIYTIEMKTSIASTIYLSSSTFQLTIFNDYPIVVAPIPTQTLTVGRFYNYQVNVTAVFKEPNSESLLLSAYKTNGDFLPNWLKFYPYNNSFIGFPTLEQTMNITVFASDPYQSNVSTTFSLNVLNNAPVVVNRPKDYCYYISTIDHPLVIELPKIFNDSDGHDITVTAQSIGGGAGSLPIFLYYDYMGQVFTRILSQALILTDNMIQLTGTDEYGLSTKTTFRFQVLQTQPYVNKVSNSSCLDWLTFTYLDDENVGVYFMNYSPCFGPPSTSFKYNATYSDDIILPFDLIRVNSTIGELRINAQNKYYGLYNIKITATDSCSNSASLYLIVLINTSPKSKAQYFPTQIAYLYEDFLFKIPSDWFYDPENQTLTVVVESGISEGWLSFNDGYFKTLSGQPSSDQQMNVILRASDPYGQFVKSILTINIVKNDKPSIINTQKLLYEYVAGQTFSINLPKIFSDTDQLHHSMTFNNNQIFPAWVNFNPVSMKISGRYPISVKENTLFNFTIFAHDNSVTFSSKQIQLIILYNDAPVFSSNLTNHYIQTNQNLTYVVPIDTFSDRETPSQEIIYDLQTASSDLEIQNFTQTYLKWNQMTRNIQVSPMNQSQSVGTWRYYLTAKDNLGQESRASFFIEISQYRDTDVSQNYKRVMILIGLLAAFFMFSQIGVQIYLSIMMKKENQAKIKELVDKLDKQD